MTMCSLEERAERAAEDVAKYNGLDDSVKNILQTQYCYAAVQERKLQEGCEGTFGQAVESLKLGRKVCRRGWNGEGMFLWLKPFALVKSEWCKDPELYGIADKNGGTIEALATICMKTADNRILTGWVASQTDVLSNDWVLVK